MFGRKKDITERVHKTVTLRMKKSGSILLTKGFVLQPKINLIWPFLNNGGGSLKMLKGLSKFLEREI